MPLPYRQRALCRIRWLAVRAPVGVALHERTGPQLRCLDAGAAPTARLAGPAVDPARAPRAKIAGGRSDRSVFVGVQQPVRCGEQFVEVGDIGDLSVRVHAAQKQQLVGVLVADAGVLGPPAFAPVAPPVRSIWTLMEVAEAPTFVDHGV